jgi:hypothetical protein
LERAAAETLVNRSVLSLVLESFLWGGAGAGIIAAKVMSEVKNSIESHPAFSLGALNAFLFFSSLLKMFVSLFFRGLRRL